MKKHLLFVLTIMMVCVGLFAVAEEAEPTKYTSGDYEYILLEDGTVEITKYTGNDTEVTVPETLDGYSVTGIGDDAFFMCTSLTVITLPEGLTSIGNFAFFYCESLTGITLPDSVVEMGINPFLACEKLTNIWVSPDNPVFATIDGVLFHKAEKKLVCYPCAFIAKEYQVPKGISSIGVYAFADCSALTDITLPEGVNSIEDYAFTYCSALTSITLPEELISIGDSAFTDCGSLTGITLPEGLTSIGHDAFSSCTSLTEITLPDSVVEMGINPFANCGKLTDIRVSPEQPVFVTIDGVLFNKTEEKLVCYPCAFTATEYQVPDGICTIGNGAFSGCTSLTSITLPESLSSIGAYAFHGCPENMQFTVVRDSWAAGWCKENVKNYTYTDSLDWLNE